jgi:hypothetical protein
MVTQGVLDKDGDALASGTGFESSFTTGAAPADGGSLVTGMVSVHTSLGLRPLPFASVSGIIIVNDPGVETAYIRGAIADANGVYEFRDFEKPYFGAQTTSVWVEIGAGTPSFPGYNQPCGALVRLEKNLRARIDVELFPSDEPRPDSISKIHPSMSGVVYEQTAAGRVPLPGVLVYAGNGRDMAAAASTTTDKDGRYAFCRVTDLLELFAFKTGFENGYLWWTAPRPEGVVDIELKRLH